MKQVTENDLLELAKRASESGQNSISIVLYGLLGSLKCGADKAYAKSCQDFVKEIRKELLSDKN